MKVFNASVASAINGKTSGGFPCRPDGTLDFNYWRARDLASARYGEPIGEGYHRVVFRDGDFVVKVPTKDSGVWACDHELCHQGPTLAVTSLDTLATETGMPIVRMEYVERTNYSKESDWTWFVDGGQVGLTKDGRLVAYDWEHCHR